MSAGPLIHDRARSPLTQHTQLPVRILRRSRPHLSRELPFTLGATLALIGIIVAAVLIRSVTTGGTHRQPVIDPGLILRPQTASLTADSGPVRALLQAAPLIPGANHFTLTLHDHGKPIVDAQVTLTAAMPGMQMRPIRYPANETSAGVYMARGPVTMFGRWHFDLRIQRARMAPVHMTFSLLFDLPVAAVTRAGS